VIVPLHIFLPRHTKNLVLILNCSRKSRQMLVSGAVACSLGRRDRIISRSLITLVLTFYAIAAVLSSFYANSSSTDSPNATNALAFCINLFGFVPVAVVLLSCLWWLLRIALVEISHRIYGKDQPPLASKAKASLGEAYTGNYLAYRVWFVLALISWGIYCASLASVYKSNSNLDDEALFVDVLPYILFVLSQSALSVRLVKFEVLQSLVSTIHNTMCFQMPFLRSDHLMVHIPHTSVPSNSSI
jgi:hypothetical protein